jgi:hypothetical protein
MNKKKAYTGMKTPVLMKVGNSAVLRVSRKTAEIFPQWSSFLIEQGRCLGRFF